MKKQIQLIGAALVLTVLLVACAKEQQQQQSAHAAQQFQRVSQPDDQRLLFGMLTPAEKTALAAQHLDFCAEYYRFTDAQIGALETIKSRLLTVYASADPENDPETASIQLDINQYFASLTEEQRLVTFSSMVLDEEGVQAIIANTGTGTNGTNDCNCSASSNYCSSSWGPTVLCDKSKCQGSSWGCGTLWLYACNGKCKLF